MPTRTRFTAILTIFVLGAFASGFSSGDELPTLASPAFDVEVRIIPSTRKSGFQYPERSVLETYSCEAIVLNPSRPLAYAVFRVDVWPGEEANVSHVYGPYRYELRAMIDEDRRAAVAVVSIYQGDVVIARHRSRVNFR